MINRFVIASILPAFALTGATAQTGSGTLGVTATVAGSMDLTFSTDVSGLSVTGTNTSTASLDFGTVSVCVDQSNSALTAYTLSVQLAAADSINSWVLGSTDISAGGVHDLTIAGAYAADVPYTLRITVPASSTPGLISNSIHFSVVGR